VRAARLNCEPPIGRLVPVYCDITPVPLALRNGNMRCAALKCDRRKHLTEIPRGRVFICQTETNTR